MGSDMIWVADPKALHHILVSRAYDYPKPEVGWIIRRTRPVNADYWYAAYTERTE